MNTRFGKIGIFVPQFISEQMRGKERLTTLFLEKSIYYTTSCCSIRESSYLLEHFLCSKFPKSTILESIAKVGNSLKIETENTLDSIFSYYGIDREKLSYSDGRECSNSLYHDISNEQKDHYIEFINELNKKLPDNKKIDTNLINTLENPSLSVLISIDDVLVKQQKSKHNPDVQRESKFLSTTNIVVWFRDKKYYISGTSIHNAFEKLIAVLLENNLTEYNFVFFSDGAKNIYKEIKENFHFGKYKIILDWYHMRKKISELVSSSLKGNKEKRSEICSELASLLWFGKVDEAIKFCENQKNNEKNNGRIDEFIKYINFRRNYIPCYHLRQKLRIKTNDNFRNSSNIVERANFLTVAGRQKGKGMSWSQTGSITLALIACMRLNKHFESWSKTRKLTFKFSNQESIGAAIN